MPWCRISIVLIFHSLLSIINPVSSQWSYANVNQWYQNYPACGGKSQSPIDVQTNTTQLLQISDPFSFTNYDQLFAYTQYNVLNNGHTVTISFVNNTGSPVRVSGGDLGSNSFALQQFHFHWGGHKDTGSEHTLNGDHYSMEIHLVHYNTSKGTYDQASSQPRGLAVLAVFVLIGKDDNPTFNQIIAVFKNISYENQKVNTTISFPLQSLLPNTSLDFYRYDGSLTTPPCYESVIWTLFREPIYISQRQMDAFRSLHEVEEPEGDKSGEKDDDEKDDLKDNFRPVQQLNGRVVWRTFQLGQDWFYDDTSLWNNHYPMCDGDYQSPIDIISTRTATPSSSAIPLSFSGFSSVKSLTLVNTGFTVEGRMNTLSAPSLAGGVFTQGARYLLYRISLRFSLTDGATRSTEHTIDGNKYPLEIQLLFYNAKYSGSDLAQHQPDGLAGLAIFGKVSSGASLPLLNNLDAVKNPGSQYTWTSFQADTLLPQDCCRTSVGDVENWKHEYFTYNGSMTTPSCQQSVTWVVLPEPVLISSDQLATLRNLNLQLANTSSVAASKSSSSPTSTSVNVTSNCRPAQSIGDRSIIYYKQPDWTLAANSVSVNYILVFLLVVVLALQI